MARNTAGFAGAALANALNETFDINNPLGQLVTTSLGSAVTNVFLDSAIDNIAVSNNISADAVKNILRIGGADLNFSHQVFSGEVVNNFYNGLGGLVSGEFFKYLDQKWSTFNLTNIGSSLGGIIGNFLAPGIGGFIGQVAGGIVFDILDGEPRSFHKVYWDVDKKKFISEFAFSKDNGQVKTSQNLADSALGSVQLAAAIIGGKVQAIQTFEYGHYESDLVYSASGGGRIRFTDATEMLNKGVLAQLRTLQISGGNEYAKSLLNRSGYDPALAQFFTDLGAADAYGLQKEDPYLFGMQMINLADANARRFGNCSGGWR